MDYCLFCFPLRLGIPFFLYSFLNISIILNVDYMLLIWLHGCRNEGCFFILIILISHSPLVSGSLNAK